MVVETAPQKVPETEPTNNNGHPSSSAEPTSSAPGKSKSKKKDKDGGGAKQQQQQQRTKKAKKDVVKPLTKVVIRRLPPSMDEETFRKQIDPIPDHDDFYFVSGDWSLGKNASSRAYINFTRAEDIFLFKDKFDGYDFVDAKGVEYPAVVEFAPFQELPRNRSRKKDAKCGTIETDTHFVAFQEALEAEEKDAAGKSKSKLEYSYKIKDEKKITSTPLLEFIAQKKQEKRDEKRRKLEEKKKQRKEERQKKAQGGGKGVPEVIKEEKAVDDEIVVRTVPSRLDPNQGKKDAGGGKDNEKRQRNRKDRDKNKEKDRPKPEKEEVVGGGGGGEPEKQLSRKQERDRMRKEKDKARKLEEKEKKALAAEPVKIKEKEPAPKVDVQIAQKPPTSADAPKKEVKKYSERRKETRARAETRLAELEERKDDEATSSLTSEHFKSIPNIPKIDIKKSVLTPHVAPFIPMKTSTIILGGESTSGSLPPAFPLKSVTPTPGPSEETAAAPESPPAEDSSSCEKKHEIDEKLKEAREARKIRNKNRPSIAIYQPRKRVVSGTGNGGSKEGEKSDSDRSSEQCGARPDTGGDGKAGGKGKDNKRHKLTKKASDKERPRDRRSRRKNSSDAEMGSRKNSREEIGSLAASVTEVVEALEGASLE